MMKTSVLSLGVCLGLSLLCSVSNAQNVRDPISRKFQPQHGFFESKSTTKQTAAIRSNHSYVQGQSQPTAVQYTSSRPSFLRRIWK